MNSYRNLSLVYDLFTSNVKYKKRTKYLLKLFKKFDRKPTLLLDLACGTGNFSFEFAKKGIDVIGVDMSEDMLSVAMSKNTKNQVMFLNQKGEELELYGTVDGAICCLDSLNHITDYRNFKKCISRVSLFLEPERLFIFDVNTPYKHENVLGNNTFSLRKRGVYCVWTNRFIESENLVESTLDVTIDNETYREIIKEKAYTNEEIEFALKEAGLQVLSVYEENTLKVPNKKSQRIVFVTRKV